MCEECVVVVSGCGGVRDVNVFSFGSWFVLFLYFLFVFQMATAPERKPPLYPVAPASTPKSVRVTLLLS